MADIDVTSGPRVHSDCLLDGEDYAQRRPNGPQPARKGQGYAAVDKNSRRNCTAQDITTLEDEAVAARSQGTSGPAKPWHGATGASGGRGRRELVDRPDVFVKTSRLQS